MGGEGAMLKSKMRRVNSCKCVHVEDETPTTLFVGHFESLASEFWILKDIVMWLPEGSGESSSGPRSYVSQSEFDAYIIYQRKQKVKLDKF
ncbi:hypothetical protein H5410_027396 [Solanum commersonii]|uniref:Uncharacterized protein n=1 Tax=Solanum commersonii TaxID=4109 RepID=A0A9J5Z1Q7_SOLCO|nr:hypothetical protein H5410_027396 [Solanum commersonii]